MPVPAVPAVAATVIEPEALAIEMPVPAVSVWA
jgi:hypothetical protein